MMSESRHGLTLMVDMIPTAERSTRAGFGSRTRCPHRNTTRCVVPVDNFSCSDNET